jgi:hypothetical protein
MSRVIDVYSRSDLQELRIRLMAAVVSGHFTGERFKFTKDEYAEMAGAVLWALQTIDNQADEIIRYQQAASELTSDLKLLAGSK